MFKFGFDRDGEMKDVGEEKGSGSDDEDKFTAAEVEIDQDETPLQDRVHHFISLCNDEITIRKSEATAPSHVSPSGVDIVPRVYEGGYKLWEGAIDLAEYLHTSHAGEATLLRDGCSVLELGGGHAIPAIVATRCGVRDICVQDLNEDVLRDVTIPNVMANVSGDVHATFYKGSWESLPSVIGRPFDVILSAETTYADAQVRSLSECMLRLLRVGGVALVAGKSYYFGVGGGMRAFETCVKALAGEMEMTVEIAKVHEIRDGVSNVREIVRVQRIK